MRKCILGPQTAPQDYCLGGQCTSQPNTHPGPACTDPYGPCMAAYFIIFRYFFLLEHAGELRIFVLIEKGGWSKLQSPAHLLGPGRGLQKHQRAIYELHKRVTLGPDHNSLISLHLFYYPSWVQGSKTLGPREPP